MRSHHRKRGASAGQCGSRIFFADGRQHGLYMRHGLIQALRDRLLDGCFTGLSIGLVSSVDGAGHLVHFVQTRSKRFDLIVPSSVVASLNRLNDAL